MPTIIEELAMTLKLDPSGFKEGAEETKISANQLLQAIIGTLTKLEQFSAESAKRTATLEQQAIQQREQRQDDAAKRAEEQARRQATAAQRQAEDAAKKSAESMRAAGRQMEDAFSRVGSSIRRVGVELLSMMGISMSVSAIERLFSGINRANLEAGFLARNIGVNVTQLTQWEAIAKSVGGTAEGVADAFKNISNQEQEYATKGTSTMLPAARDLFDTILLKENGQFLKGDEFVDAIRAGAKRLGLTPEQIRYRAEQGGFGGLTPELTATDAELAQARKSVRESGDFTTPEDAEAAKQLNLQLEAMLHNVRGLAREFWRGLGPAITDIVTRINTWISANRDWIKEEAIKWGRRLGEALTALAHDFDLLINGGAGEFATTVGEIANAANEAAKAMGGWQPVLETFADFWIGSRIAGILTSMAGIATGIAAVGAAAVTTTAALIALAAVWVGNKMGQNDIYQRAEAMGYKVNKGGWLTDTTFTKDGETISMEEMSKREGYGPAGQTIGQSFGFGRPSLPNPAIPGGSADPGAGAGGGRKPADADAGANSTDLSGGVGATQEQTNAFRSVLGLRESGGRYGIMGGSSGRFAGKYQMGRAEIEETAKRLGEPAPSTQEFLNNPEMQERYFANYTLDHHRRLMRDPTYAAMSPENQLAQLATAHLKGVGGALAQMHGGSAGVDAFGTSGSSYRDMIKREMTRLAQGEHATPAPTSAAQIAAQTPPPLPPRPPLVASPAAVATLAPPPPTASLAGSNAARRDAFATNIPAKIGASTAAEGFQMSTDNSSTTTDQSSEVHIGALHVHSRADNAAGIAKDVHAELKNYRYAQHADVGLV